jgi:hypothetical protein
MNVKANLIKKTKLGKRRRIEVWKNVRTTWEYGEM